ncbi:MAG TPA: iron-sulfur cluster repair di-iron protein [Candidatus Acidoferrales bacterium]|nr:iron-sulfur cluster repair di-iron protein [Candidatus Acidoferrales bacterium]
MIFSTETKVRDIVLSDPAARRVLEEAGVDYCCGGGKSLREACLAAGAPAEEILKQLREHTGEACADDAHWNSARLCDLTAHICEKHHRYVREAIARIRPLLEKVKAKHGENHRELAEIERLFLEVGGEMLMHMQKEEQILFPYIDAVEQAASGGASLEPPFFQSVRNPIRMMMNEHDSAGDLVRQIRKATVAYTPPADACTSFTALYQELRQFEADLHQHVHLENNILFPRAVEMEAAVV